MTPRGVSATAARYRRRPSRRGQGDEPLTRRHRQGAVREVDARVRRRSGRPTARFGSRGLTVDHGVVALCGDDMDCTADDLHRGGDGLGVAKVGIVFSLSLCGQRTQPLKCLSVLARGCRLPPSADATARTSHAFTDSPSARAAASTGDLKLSGTRSVTRHVPPSSSASGTGATGSGSSRTAGLTVNSGSRPRNRTSTDLGAISRVISCAASDSASSNARRMAESSGAVSLLGERFRVRAARGGGYRQFMADPVDVRLQIHDTMLTP